MENSNRQWLVLLSLIVIALNAKAQTTFSFSGLQWGTSPDQVESQLKASGLTLSGMTQKIKCKVIPTCSIDFEGYQVRGSASFVNQALVEVMLYSDSESYADRAAKMKSRYGSPLPPPPQSGENYGKYITETLRNLNWSANSGETLELHYTGFARYRSGPLNKSEQSRQNSIKF